MLLITKKNPKGNNPTYSISLNVKLVKFQQYIATKIHLYIEMNLHLYLPLSIYIYTYFD